MLIEGAVASMSGIALALLASLGHLWAMIFVINRIHSTGISRHKMKLIDACWYLVTLGLPLWLLAGVWRETPWSWNGALLDVADGESGVFATDRSPAVHAIRSTLLHVTDTSVSWVGGLKTAFLAYGITAFALTLMRWGGRKFLLGEAEQLLRDTSRQIDVIKRLGKAPCGSLSTRLACAIPGNEVFQLALHEKHLLLPQLAPELDGITITHLSDLHFTGRVTSDYFNLIVELSNELNSDMVIITGDIIDKRRCFDWLEKVLGPLDARLGVYFVLGNHDLRVRDESGVRSSLERAGLIDLGKRWTTIEVGQQTIVLAGNELPWFEPAADLTTLPSELTDAFRIGVAHSPDRLPWAKRNRIDLLLAGHTHGGQVRLPIIGPVFSPSRYGAKYCGGTFYERPTLMHVSRGLSGTRSLRLNCPPELARLTLRRSV